MKILFVCHRFPYPADGGAKIRPLRMIQHLSQRHEVHLVSMLRDEREAAEAHGIRQWCASFAAPRLQRTAQLARTAAAPLRGLPLSFGYFGSPAVQAAVDTLRAQHRFDRVVAFCSSAAPYVAAMREAPKLLDFCDVDSEKWRLLADTVAYPRRAAFRYEARALARWERRLAAQFELSTVATPAELATLRLQGATRADWFPNGVDVDYFAPLPEPHDADLLCFVGRMDYLPNEACVVDFVRHAWPLVRAARPAARFAIVGAAPTAAVRALAAVDGVEVTGQVPDVRPWLGRAAAMVAPLAIARGVQNKVLEAMSMGVPVVTSTLVTRGVDAVVGKDLLAADGAAAVAQAALSCMDEPARRARLSAAGRALVLGRYRWDGAMDRFERLLAGLDGEARSVSDCLAPQPATVQNAASA